MEANTNKGWVEIANGTTVGNRRILVFDSLNALGVRVYITESLGPITLESFNVYMSQPSQGRILDDDGGWCWFQDERCIEKNGMLYVGTVSSGYKDARRKGDINVIEYTWKQVLENHRTP